MNTLPKPLDTTEERLVSVILRLQARAIGEDQRIDSLIRDALIELEVAYAAKKNLDKMLHIWIESMGDSAKELRAEKERIRNQYTQ